MPAAPRGSDARHPRAPHRRAAGRRRRDDVRSRPAPAEEQITPLLLAVHDAPMPFKGSDGRTHLVYELWITNFSSADAQVEQVEVLGDARPLATLDAAAVAARLQPAGRREASDTLPSGGTSLLFVHLTLGGRRLGAGAVVAPGPGARRRGAPRQAADDAQRRRRDRRPPRPGRDRSPLRGGTSSPPIRAATLRATRAPRCRSTAASASRSATPSTGNSWTTRTASMSVRASSSSSYTIYGREALAVADAPRRRRRSTTCRSRCRASSRRRSRSPRRTATPSCSISAAGASRSMPTCNPAACGWATAIASSAGRCSGWSATPATRSRRTSLPRDGRPVAARLERPALRDRCV